MKITCLSCGKVYDSEKDELCPKCGSYNPFTRDNAFDIGERERSYHNEEKYREADFRGKADIIKDKLEQKATEKYFGSDREEYSETTKKLPQYKRYGRTYRTKEYGSADTYSRMTKSKKEKGSIKSLIAKLFAVYFIVGTIVSECSVGFFQEMIAKTENEVSAVNMSELHFEQNQGIKLNDELEMEVLGCASVPLSEEQAAIIAANSDKTTDGMQLTVVSVSLDSDREFLKYGETSVYLKADGIAYRPLDIWDLNEAFREEYGMEVYTMFGYTQPEVGVILFLTPEGSQNEGYEFCIQQQREIRPADITVTDRLIVVDIEEA